MDINKLCKQVTIRTWDRLYEEYKNFKNEKESWIFRGEVGSYNKKKPGREFKTSFEKNIEEFYPDYKKKRSKHSKLESGLLRLFKRECYKYLEHVPKNKMEWLSLMRHYGAPTRLLDWTYSFFVAIYFTVEKWDGEKGSSLWAINTKWLNDCFKNRYREEYEKIDGKDRNLQKQETFNLIDGKDLVIKINPYRLNERLVLQQGVFLFPCNIEKSFMENLNATIKESKQSKIKENIIRYSIPKNIKDKNRIDIIKCLYRMNMHKATLFPGLDGFARSLKMRLTMPDILRPDDVFLKQGCKLFTILSSVLSKTLPKI